MQADIGQRSGGECNKRQNLIEVSFSPHLRKEADQVSETLCFSVIQYWTRDKILNPSGYKTFRICSNCNIIVENGVSKNMNN
jgi:hypothetical protein